MSQVEVKSKETKLSDLIDYRIRVATHDGRVYIGQLMAFDAYMNLVLGDCVEEKLSRKQVQQVLKSGGDLSTSVKVEKRVFGLMILRGEHVLSTSVESGPLLTKKERIEVEKKNNKKLNNSRKSRQGKTVNSSKKQPASGTNTNKKTGHHTGTTGKPAENSYRVAKPESRQKSPAGSRFNAPAPVRPSRFQAPPGFKKRT